MPLITGAIKDKVLLYLCEYAIPEQLCSGETDLTLQALELDFETFAAIMVQFQRFGFVEDLNLRRSYLSFILRIDAHDFVLKGGFVVQDEIFKANVERLGFEIDNLRKQLAPDKLDTVEKLASIAGALFGGLALLPK